MNGQIRPSTTMLRILHQNQNYDVDPIATTGPHNTWINPNGKRAYLEVLTVPYLYIADTATNQILGKIGPFSKGIRPFAVTEDDKYVYANIDGLLGFEIGEAKPGGRMLYRVEAHTPPERVAQVEPPAHKPHSTQSHGLNLRPDRSREPRRGVMATNRAADCRTIGCQRPESTL